MLASTTPLVLRRWRVMGSFPSPPYPTRQTSSRAVTLLATVTKISSRCHVHIPQRSKWLSSAASLVTQNTVLSKTFHPRNLGKKYLAFLLKENVPVWRRAISSVPLIADVFTAPPSPRCQYLPFRSGKGNLSITFLEFYYSNQPISMQRIKN